MLQEIIFEGGWGWVEDTHTHTHTDNTPVQQGGPLVECLLNVCAVEFVAYQHFEVALLVVKGLLENLIEP
jgi:hypothetical protein